MSSRLQALERRRSSQIDMDSSIRRDETELDLVAPSKQPDLNLADIHTRRPPTLDYVKDLQKSWVYRRNYALPTSHLSVSTKSRHSTHWSVISGLSMAEVSNISVLNLLVTENETINTHRSLQTWSNLRSIPVCPRRAHHHIANERLGCFRWTSWYPCIPSTSGVCAFELCL